MTDVHRSPVCTERNAAHKNERRALRNIQQAGFFCFSVAELDLLVGTADRDAAVLPEVSEQRIVVETLRQQEPVGGAEIAALYDYGYAVRGTETVYHHPRIAGLDSKGCRRPLIQTYPSVAQHLPAGHHTLAPAGIRKAHEAAGVAHESDVLYKGAAALFFVQKTFFAELAYGFAHCYYAHAEFVHKGALGRDAVSRLKLARRYARLENVHYLDIERFNRSFIKLYCPFYDILCHLINTLPSTCSGGRPLSVRSAGTGAIRSIFLRGS